MPTDTPLRKHRTVADQLCEVQDQFIRRWGEMGATWGINRTQAEIFAFLFVTGQPQCTDDVMDRLNISRGNASMSLRALCDWGIIRRFHRRGERRDYFEALEDVWEVMSIITAERKKREMDPVLDTIRECREALEAGAVGAAAAKEDKVATSRRRLGDMEDFMAATNEIFEVFVAGAKSGLRKMATQLLGAINGNGKKKAKKTVAAT
ncbi:MAG: transcriptional regulator [Planctomycetota bacterium]